jgi:hypothetical protein
MFTVLPRHAVSWDLLPASLEEVSEHLISHLGEPAPGTNVNAELARIGSNLIASLAAAGFVPVWSTPAADEAVRRHNIDADAVLRNAMREAMRRPRSAIPPHSGDPEHPHGPA